MLPVCLGDLSLENPIREASRGYAFESVKVTTPLVEHIVTQTIRHSRQSREKEQRSSRKRQRGLERGNHQRPSEALDLAAEKGSSVWLTVLQLREMGSDQNKREFRDANKLCYDWLVNDIPSICVCGEVFTADHAHDLQTRRICHPTI